MLPQQKFSAMLFFQSETYNALNDPHSNICATAAKRTYVLILNIRSTSQMIFENNLIDIKIIVYNFEKSYYFKSCKDY